MKRVLRVLLAACLLLACTGCGGRAMDAPLSAQSENLARPSEPMSESEVKNVEPISELEESSISDHENQITSIINQAETFTNKEDYSGALKIIASGLEAYPESERLLSKEKEYMNLFAQAKQDILSEAAGYVQSEDYVGAIALLQKSQKIYAEDTEYQKFYEICCRSYQESILSKAEGFAENGEYIAAIQEINTASALVGDSADLSEKVQEYRSLYAQGARANVFAALDNGNVKSALLLLKGQKADCPDKETLEILQENIRANSILTYKLFATTHDDSGFNPEKKEDTLGNTYYDVDVFVLPDGRYYEYNIIDEEIKYYTFTVAPYYFYKEDRTGTLQVYADDDLIWSSGEITRKSEPVDVVLAIPVSCKFIKIQCSANGYPYSDIMSINPLLWS